MSKLDFSQQISDPAVRPEDVLAGDPSSTGPNPPILRSRSGSLRGLSSESGKADVAGGGSAASQSSGGKPMTIRRAASGFFTQLSQIKRVESVGRMFSTESSAAEGSEKQPSPAHGVLSHALILWLGDLNYRSIHPSIHPSICLSRIFLLVFLSARLGLCLLRLSSSVCSRRFLLMAVCSMSHFCIIFAARDLIPSFRRCAQD
jgi:hypothetical protein